MEEQERNQKTCTGGRVRKDGKCVMPEVTFTALIMSLNTSVLYHLGEIAAPTSEKFEKDLVLAKQTIDTLSLLQEKTKGNLNEDEQNLLKNIIFDLKMRYVRARD